MTDLTRFQDRSQAQANLRGVPASPSAPSAVGSVLGTVANFGAGIGRALAAGASNQLRVEKAEADAANEKFVGNFATKLSNAAQASNIKDTFDLEKTQRKLYQEALTARPDLSDELTKQFTNASGLKPAALTFEQQEYQDLQQRAWDNDYGSPLLSREENDRQIQLFQEAERRGKEMEAAAQEFAYNKTTQVEEFYKAGAKLISTRTESFQARLGGLMDSIANGGSRADAELAWLQTKVKWANEINKYGAVADDPTVKAMLSGITTLFETGDRFIRGEAELNEAKKASEIAIARQKQMIVSPPENARIVAASELFNHNPALNLVSAKIVGKMLSTAPTDLREATEVERKTINQTLDNMAKSESFGAKEEAGKHIVSLAEHLDRNGMDYTDENILQVCEILAVPEALNGLSKSDQSVVANACETYAVDVAGREIRNIALDGGLTKTDINLKAGGFSYKPETRTIPVDEFATLTVDDAGLRYTAAKGFENDRQAHREIQNMNRQLAKVNPVLEVYATSLGVSKDILAANIWRVGPVAEQRAKEAERKALPVGEGIDQQSSRLLEQIDQVQQLELPKVGDELQGYRFLGGDPADQNNWEKL